MPVSYPPSRRAGASQAPATSPDSRFDRRLNEILEQATAVFYEKGYEGASMRDLSRASGKSLAGLYYYFDSKEKLLYLIQKHTFRTVIDRLYVRLRAVTDPEQRLRVFIENHLEYFLANMKAMKVLSHESDALKNSFGEEIQAIKREYYRIAFGVIEELRQQEIVRSSAQRSRGANVSASKAAVSGGRRNASNNNSATGEDETRVAVLSLFGMLNWIYTWHNPKIDGDAGKLATRMADLFLHGVFSVSEVGVPGAGKSSAARKKAARR